MMLAMMMIMMVEEDECYGRAQPRTVDVTPMTNTTPPPQLTINVSEPQGEVVGGRVHHRRWWMPSAAEAS